MLVARESHDLPGWPQRVIVAVDGSPGSAAAFAAAETIARRYDAGLRPVVAKHDETVLHALHVLSEDADLLVVGSRGLRGLRALGSVSERIAHEARCSVLVVRAADE